MKIGEVAHKYVEGLDEWVKNCTSLDDEKFLESLSELKVWEWGRIEDLGPLAKVLDRIDTLLYSALETQDQNLLSFLLAKTCLLVRHANSKTLYNSLDQLIQTLDYDSWEVVYQTLSVLHLLVNRISPTIKNTKAHSNPEVSNKLYVIALGSQLNNPNPISLEVLASCSSISNLDFQYMKGQTLIQNPPSAPENLSYTWLNRMRTKAVLSDHQKRQLAVASQLLAISVFLQMSPEGGLFQDFCRSLPELWMLPSLVKLLKGPLVIQVPAIHVIAGVLVMMEDQPRSENPQLLHATNQLLAPWQQHGLLQTMLRDLAFDQSEVLSPDSKTSEELVEAVLHLSSIIADYKYRVDPSHVSGMTCSLLQMLEVPSEGYKFSLSCIAKAARILSVLASHSIEMFKELEGLSRTLSLAIFETARFTGSQKGHYAFMSEVTPDQHSRAYLVRAVLRLVKIALNKWEPSPSIPTSVIRQVLDSGITQAFQQLFDNKKFEVYESTLHLLVTMINEQPPIISELVSDNTLVSALRSLETPLPPQPKFLCVISKLLCAMVLQEAGVKVVQEFSTITHTLKAFGGLDSTQLSNDMALAFAENIKEVMTADLTSKEKAVEGCVQLVNNLHQTQSKESFFTQLNNVGRLLSMIFNYSADVIRGFLDSGGLDNFLAVFKLPIMPLTYRNEFHSVLTCFKSIPMNLTPLVLSKVLETLSQQLVELQEVTGCFTESRDFSQVPEDSRNNLLHKLTATDSFVDMTRLVIQYGTGVHNVDELCQTFVKLAEYNRVLIAEQARISSFSKPNDKKTKEFNIPTDIQDIENPDLKTFEENFYFTCQLSVRRLLRFAIKLPSAKSGQNLSDEECTKVSNTVGKILNDMLQVMDLQNIDQGRAYHLCLHFSEILKMLMYSFPPTILAFSNQGGLESIKNFLMALKELSFQLHKEQELPYDLVNCLQILWKLGGECLKNLGNGQYALSNYPVTTRTLKHMGVENSKEVVRIVQTQVVSTIEQLGYLECGLVSTIFIKSVLEIFKNLDYKKDSNVDSQNLQRLIEEVGLDEHSARNALVQSGNDFSQAAAIATERPLEVKPLFPGNLHEILINSMSAVSSMHAAVTDLLLKLEPRKEVAELALGVIGHYVQDLLGYSFLKVPNPKLSPLQVPSSFSALCAALTVLSNLCSSSREVLNSCKSLDLETHLVNLLEIAAGDFQGEYRWLFPLFSGLNCLVKFTGSGSQKLVGLLAQLIRKNSEANSKILGDSDLGPLLSLLVSLTTNSDYAKTFLEEEGLRPLLTAKSLLTESKQKVVTDQYFSLLKQLVQDPYILQADFQVAILNNLNGPQPLNQFLESFTEEIKRNSSIFQKSFENTCSVVKKQEEVYVQAKGEIKEIQAERWDTVVQVAHAIADIHTKEQETSEKLVLHNENLLSMLGDLIHKYPLLASQLLGHNVNTFDSMACNNTTKRFLTHLLKNILPFKYTLSLQEDKITFLNPNTQTNVSAEAYQNWMKVVVKLVKSLCFKQAHRDPSSQAGQVLNSTILAQNTPVTNARKRVFRELRDLLSDHTRKSWFSNDKSVSIVRSCAILLLQLLKEPSKPPYTNSNTVEIAKMLVSEQFNFIKLLADGCKGINLHFKKAGSFLNILLAPLELLTRYNITFTLHLSAPNQEDQSESSEEEPEEYEMYPVEDYSDEMESDESMEDESMGSDMSMDDEEMDDEEEDPEDESDQDLLDEDLEEEYEQLEDLVMEPRGSDTFWGEDVDEDLGANDFIESHNSYHSPDRNLLESDLNADLDELQPGFLLRARELARDEDMQIISEFEPNDEVMQIQVYRNRPRETQVRNPPRSPQVDLQSLYQQYASTAEPAGQEFEEPMNIEEEEEKAEEVHEAIDPAFLEALPPDIREEVLGQFRQAQPQNAQENIPEDFLEALPPEIRAELEVQQAQEPAQEIDNASFIASLTPDLRREVLLTAGPELLESLPPELIAEARQLNQPPHYMAERPQRRTPDNKYIGQIVADDKLAGSLVQIEDSFVEALLRSLFLVSPLNRDILASLLLNLSANPQNRNKVLDGLVSLLMQQRPSRDFPPQQLYGSHNFLQNYDLVYAIVAGRALDLLSHLTSFNPKVSTELCTPTKYKLNIAKTTQGESVRCLSNLMHLLRWNPYRVSAPHLNSLVTLMKESVEKAQETPTVNSASVESLCAVLDSESMNEATMKNFIDLIAKLCENPQNKTNIDEIFSKEVEAVGTEVSALLKQTCTSESGSTELKLLRLCKVLTSVLSSFEGPECVWEPLSEALIQLTQSEKEILSTTNPTLSKVLPVIESFFIYHRQKGGTEHFQNFCERSKRILNQLVKQNPFLLNDTLHSLVTHFYNLLDFENKRNYFRTEIRKLRNDRGYDTIKLNVRRQQMFMDSFHQLKVRSPSEMYGKLKIQFIGEEGVDVGGLTREWYALLAREIFNPNYALFNPSANGVSFQPNSKSYINPDHLSFFKFVGRIIGKAICDGVALDVYFTRSFYKHILGQEVRYNDMEDLDPDFYRNLQMLTEINLDDNDLHEYYFAYEEEEFGRIVMKELVPGGKNIRVTETNKMDYIKEICHMKMTKEINSQIQNFLEGFYEMVPKHLVGIFDAKELELLIAGLPEIDITDLKLNTEYRNYTKDSQVIQWFWEILFEFTYEERAEFLQFVTGSAKVPLEGFKALQGMGGVQKFQVHKSFTGPDRLPTAHTCMNQLDLPEYPSKEVLYQRLKIAISEGKEGFAFM